MGSARDILLAIFSLSLLILVDTFLSVSVKLSQLPWTYRKLSIESSISLYFLNCPLSVSIPLSLSLSLSLSSFISSFLSGHSVSAVVDGHCSPPKPINSDVPQGSVLSPTLSLLFINDLLSIINCPIHSYADNSALHFSTSIDRRF